MRRVTGATPLGAVTISACWLSYAVVALLVILSSHTAPTSAETLGTPVTANTLTTS